MSTKNDPNNRTIVVNKRAKHVYAIEETFEAGMVLHGSEVKSIRAGAVILGDGYIAPGDGELWLENVHISEYRFANRFNHPPDRRRKLLLQRRQIDRITERIQKRGQTCVPLRLYLVKGRAKLEIGLGRGKKLHDRRQDLKARDAKREMDRAMKH